MAPKLIIDAPYPYPRNGGALTVEEATQNMLYWDEERGFKESKEYLATLESSRPYRRVRDFHKRFNHPVSDVATEMGKERRDTRFNWILEELDEFKHADHLVDQVDALIDILYLTYGTFVELGVDPSAHFEHVHDANMRKLDSSGSPLYKEDGKIAKPAGWRGPEMDIARTLVLDSVDKFRDNPMFAALDLKGIKDLRQKYENLQSRYGDQLSEEIEKERTAESIRRFQEENQARNNPFLKASREITSGTDTPRLT